MSVLIKGMEMPKDIEPGLVIEFADGIDGKRYARLYHYRHGGLTEWLEAVPVPPHGRLIDADAFIGTIRPLCEEDKFAACTFETVKRLMVEHINNAPTIIPAELPVHHGTFAATSEQEALKRIAPAEEGEA